MKHYIIISCLLCSWLANAQTENFANKFLVLTEKKEVKATYAFTAKVNNPLDFILTNLFIGYKKFVSSQDVSSCNFEPSCSVYALQAINKQGLIFGSLNFFDRFARCNPLSPEQYEPDYKRKLLLDPLRNFKNELIEK